MEESKKQELIAYIFNQIKYHMNFQEAAIALQNINDYIDLMYL